MRIISWLINNITNIYVYNNDELKTEFYNKPIWIGGSISNNIIYGWRKIWLCLNQKHNTIKVIFDFKDIFFLSNGLYNLDNLILLNNYDIFYNIKIINFYNLKTKEIITQIKCLNNSFLFQSCNFLNIAVNIIIIFDNIY